MIDFLKNTIGFYTLTSIAGIILTLLLYLHLGKRRDLTWRQMIPMFAFAVAGLLAGAHMLFFIVGLPDWIVKYSGQIHSFADFIVAFGYGASGLVFYGGLLGAYVGILIFCRIYKMWALPEFNHATVVFPFFHVFGRIGCALTGCCYGIEYHGIFALQYTAADINPGISDDVADFPRFPVQLLEALLELLIFIFLYILYKKTKDKYSITSIYLLIYSVVRFFDEFLRGDAARKIWGPFSTSQWISLVIFVCVAAYTILKKIQKPDRKLFAV